MSLTGRHTMRDSGLARGGVGLAFKKTKKGRRTGRMLLMTETAKTTERKVKKSKHVVGLPTDQKVAASVIEKVVFPYRPDLVKDAKKKHLKLSKIRRQQKEKKEAGDAEMS